MKSYTKEFIEKAEKVHGKKFDYSKVEYKKSSIKVEIVCNKHGSFFQTPNNHLRGKGCRSCFGTEKLTVETFLTRARIVHGTLFDYSKVHEIKSAITKVEIICKEHGSFFQSPNNHLNHKQGCAKCKGLARLTTDDLIINAKKVHPKENYDYSKVNYINARTKIEIICPIKDHGSFWQTSNNHVSRKHGCPICANFNTSNEEIEWLTSLKIPTLIRQYRINFNDIQSCIADGYDPETNTIYEYHGKYWHGHPERGDPDSIHAKRGTYGDRYLDTLMREIRLRELGYNVVSMWN